MKYHNKKFKGPSSEDYRQIIDKEYGSLDIMCDNNSNRNRNGNGNGNSLQAK